MFVPTDHAFQRWHPIDWGFYPFSVPEFTEDIIINHFVQGNWRQETITDGQKVKTLGGREITFGRKGEKFTKFFLGELNNQTCMLSLYIIGIFSSNFL